MEDKTLYSIIDVSRILKLPLARVRNLARINANRIPSEVQGGEKVYTEESLGVFRALVEGGTGRIVEPAPREEDHEEPAAAQVPRRNSEPARRISLEDLMPPDGGAEERGEYEEEIDPRIYYTIPKISQMSGIAESKLLEYRRRFADRIPTVGKGKDRIHPEEAVPIFKAIHREQTGERIHMLQGKQYYDLKEISILLALSRSLLYSYISEEGDKVPRVKQGKRWLFPEEAVEAFKAIRKSREDRKKRRVEGLYSIRDLSRILGISESTLHQYKRRFAEKIPSVGSGRDRKYPEEAIEVFRSLREGGPGSGKEGYYSLSQVSEMTGIPTHTLLYYRRTYPDKIPVAEGRRSRVYTDESIEAFRRLRSRPGRRGRAAAPALNKMGPRLDSIEKRIELLEGGLEEANRLLREVLERIPGQAGLGRGEGGNS